MTMPEWLPVVGYEGLYEVSDQGQVRSVLRGRLMTATATSQGYLQVTLSKGGKSARLKVHQLVMGAFVGPQEAGRQVRHLNGNPAESRLSNLAYGSQDENMADRVEHGTDPHSARTHCPSGHAYDAANTYKATSGGRRAYRQCRACRRERERLRRAGQPKGGDAA